MGASSLNDTRRGQATLSPHRQLRVNLVLAFIGMATIPVLIVALAVLNLLRTQTTNQIINQLESVVDLKHDQIARWISDGGSTLQLLFAGHHEQEIVALLAASDDHLLRVQELSEELRLLTRSVGAGAAASDLFDSLFLYDLQGRVIAASDPVLVGRIVSRQPYYAPSLSGPHVQPPFYTVGTADLSIVVTRLITGPDGAPRGVLAGQLNLDRLGEIMVVRTGLPESGETYLVSLENNYLLTPSRLPDYALNRAYRSVGIDRALAGEDGSGSYANYFDPPLPVIGAYRWVAELDAALMAEVDQAEVSRQFRGTLHVGSLITLGLSLVVAAVGFSIATRVAAPIGALTAAASQIAAGDLSRRVQLRERNEIGLLAHTFNSMAEQLQQTLAGLEQRVAERTAALEHANAAQERTLRELRASLETRDMLAATVRDLSSPVLPVQPGVLVMPLIGVVDADRANQLTEALLGAIERHQARLVLIDVTGVLMIDTQVAQVLLHAAEASRLLGAEPMLIGIRPELAQTIVGLGLDLRYLKTSADLQSGISYAVGRGTT